MPLIIDDLILLLIAIEHDNINLQNAFLHSRYRKLFLRQLSKMERTRRQTSDTKICIIASARKSVEASSTIPKRSSLNHAYWT